MKVPILVVFGLISLVSPNGIIAAEEVEALTTTTSDATPQVDEVDPIIERSSHTHLHGHVEPAFKGFWAKKFAWRPRWVKTWQEKKVYVAVWKRMWGPVEVKEWVPVPKPPPGWVKHDVGSYVVKKIPHHFSHH